MLASTIAIASPLKRSAMLGFVVTVLWTASAVQAQSGQAAPRAIPSLLQSYCLDCHAADSAEGNVDFETVFEPDTSFAKRFEVLSRAAELISDGSMPPQDEAQPSAAERVEFQDWFESKFVQSIQASPGAFRVRRLSAHEYRNTLESLLGFKLELAVIEAEQTLTETSLVMKLLPTDPPGPSGFTNDTSQNPLTLVLWEQYSLILDSALDDLLSQEHLPKELAGELERESVMDFLAGFRARAFRRVLAHDSQQLYQTQLHEHWMEHFGEKSDCSSAGGIAEFKQFIKQELKVTLMSPAFLHRGFLAQSESKNEVLPVDAFELAERLSYFLWADMPDEELMESASNGSLLLNENYRMQIRRMLASPKARNLSEDFAMQWLSLQEIENVSNNPPTMLALRSQPLDFLHYLFTEGRPLLELVDSSVSFINPHTARFYRNERKQLTAYRKQKGIEVEALPNQKILLEDTTPRGGILTMPGVLAMNRGPILRGTWLLERIIGEHLPDPPANVGQVPRSPPGQKLSFRQRFELHRSQASCAVCHDKIDPLGFSLEAYDAAGAFRKAADYKPTKQQIKRGEVPEGTIDTTGRLPSGENFEDFEGLKQILVGEKRRDVIENIARRMLEFALARKLEYYDKPTVETIVEELAKDPQSTFHDLIFAISESLPFTHTIHESDDAK